MATLIVPRWCHRRELKVYLRSSENEEPVEIPGLQMDVDGSGRLFYWVVYSRCPMCGGKIPEPFFPTAEPFYVLWP